MKGEARVERTVPADGWFANPCARFRPAAYWFWHSLPSTEEMTTQLADFAEKGYGTILIQTRLAFPRSLYMSPAFLKRYAEAVSIMAELGLVAGLYDDYNWASGQAAGLTVENADRLRERHLFWATSDSRTGAITSVVAPIIAAMGPDIADWLYEGGEARFGNWEIVAATLHPDGTTSPDNICDVTSLVTIAGVENGCEFSAACEVEDGYRLTVFLSATCLTSRLPNYLLPEVGARFVEVGLEPYASALGQLIPETLQFLFFDQPAPGFYKWAEIEGNLANSLLHSPDLMQKAEVASDCPISIVLLSLLYDVGPDTGVLRTKFYETYINLIYQSFFRPIKVFCSNHDLRLTGHEILPHVGSFDLNAGFTSIDPRVAPAVDFFGLDALRDETAVDANNFFAQLSPKLGDSVARANGRSRTMVEIYATALRTERRAAGQWELTPATLRSQSVRLHMAGARQVVMHGLYQTDGFDNDSRLFSNPRFDFAPGLNFEPWWRHHQHMSLETSRLSAFLEDFVPQTTVAVLYPLGTAWEKGPRHEHARHFGAWCGNLSALSCGHMIVDAKSLSKAELGCGTFTVNGLTFAALVMPALSSLELGELTETLGALRAAGVKVWLSREPGSNDVVENVEIVLGAPSPETVRDLVASLPRPQFAVTSDGTVANVIGTDADGWTRVVLFNDGGAVSNAKVAGISKLEFEIWDAAGATRTTAATASSLSITLDPQQFVCLRVRADTTKPSQPVSIPASLPLPHRVDILKDDWTLQISETGRPEPIQVNAGWHSQGFPSFSGTGSYITQINVREAARVILDLPGVSVAVTAYLDGRLVGACHHSPFRIDFGVLSTGAHQLLLDVSNTAANRYYAGTPYAGATWPDESGLTQPPRLLFFYPDNVE
ncbi:carbohydrate-binding protein [Rhizobium tubonense]|uniref:Carbohydrate-binding protein n=1 Tax=Rhizobium tubonense TaxID=484088 RepID=A0A2W4EL10_9HYPH|nr:carbohydrate-binding protein [Rhizobium tubonense]PZM14516.1 carbohydrate-binding protein [Rhizobium tubonense]